MKKTAIAALGGLMLMAGVSFTSCNDNKADLIPVQIGDKWSFVNSKGDIIFEDEFSNKPSVVYNGCFSVKENKGYTVYRVNGNKLEVVGALEKLNSVGYYEDGLIPASEQEERIAIYNKNGEIVFEINPIGGIEISACRPSIQEGMLAVKNNDGKWGYIDKNGEVIIKPNYDDAYSFKDGMALVMKKEDKATIYRVIDKKGDVIFKLRDGQKPIKDHEQFEHGYLMVKDGEKCLLFDKKGEAIKFSAKFTDLKETNGKYVVYKGDDGWGVATLDGEVKIRPKFEDVIIDGSEFICREKDEVLVYDANGNEKRRYEYNELIPYGSYGFFAKDGKYWYQVDKDGKEKCREYFKDINLWSYSHSSVVKSGHKNAKGGGDDDNSDSAPAPSNDNAQQPGDDAGNAGGGEDFDM